MQAISLNITFLAKGRHGIFSRAKNKEKVDEDRLRGMYVCCREENFGWNRRTAVI